MVNRKAFLWLCCKNWFLEFPITWRWHCPLSTKYRTDNWPLQPQSNPRIQLCRSHLRAESIDYRVLQPYPSQHCRVLRIDLAIILSVHAMRRRLPDIWYNHILFVHSMASYWCQVIWHEVAPSWEPLFQHTHPSDSRAPTLLGRLLNSQSRSRRDCPQLGL